MNAQASADVNDIACPACKAPVGQPCKVVIDGKRVPWTHDARILAEVWGDIRARLPLTVTVSEGLALTTPGSEPTMPDVSESESAAGEVGL